MKEENIAESILAYLNIAVLRRVGPGEYSLLGKVPDFYDKFFPPAEGEHCTTPWEHSYMLDFFYESAENFFSDQSSGSISSGTWEEENLCESDQALTAEALILNSFQVITLRLLKGVYTERTALMRKAREQLLERRLLTNDLEKYKSESRTDGLTRVLNRTAFMNILPLHFTRAQEMNIPFSLIMLDIDHFKNINDTYGHQAGDLVLSTMGELMLSRLRRDDVVGRYGGEEFIVLIPHTVPEQIHLIAEKLRKNICAHKFKDLPPITVSVGFTSYRDGDTPEGMIHRSDLALYEAKRSGRNTVREG
jgi:diguanylate cyclase (GGDEF)-like protein